MLVYFLLFNKKTHNLLLDLKDKKKIEDYNKIINKKIIGGGVRKDADATRCPIAHPNPKIQSLSFFGCRQNNAHPIAIAIAINLSFSLVRKSTNIFVQLVIAGLQNSIFKYLKSGNYIRIWYFYLFLLALYFHPCRTVIVLLKSEKPNLSKWLH